MAYQMFEFIIMKRCRNFLESTDHQFRFKKDHSTDMCIFLLKEVIDLYNRQNTPVVLCFLDAAKAFDRVNHWTLFRKLIVRKAPIFIIRLLLYWCRHQKFCIRWGDVTCDNGVRQGGVLSPRLFTLYLDDLSKNIVNTRIGCFLGNQCLNHIIYADLVLICPSVKAMNCLLKECQQYALDHDIKYNTSKSHCMFIYPVRFKSLLLPKVYLDGNVLNVVDSHVYLGTIISNSDDKDMKKSLRSLYGRANMILRRFSNCSQDVKCMLFNSYCGNLYCAHLWSIFKKQSYHEIRVAYNNSFRILMSYSRHSSASGNFVSNSVDSFDVKMRKCIYNFRERLNRSTNILIINTLGCDLNIVSNIRQRWRKLLY